MVIIAAKDWVYFPYCGDDTGWGQSVLSDYVRYVPRNPCDKKMEPIW